jgi:glucose/arabinose dehydrogenase/cytochrome c2
MVGPSSTVSVRNKWVTAISILCALVAVFVYGFCVGKFRLSPYNTIAYFEKYGNRALDILRHGKDQYVRKQLSLQMSPQAAAGTDLPQTRKSIETALLPISIESVSLTNDLAFPAGAGALTLASKNLLVLDRLGKVYVYQDKKIRELKTIRVPNGIDEYVLKSRNLDLTPDTLRTHSIAYDEKRSDLYVSFEKYVSPQENRFSIAKIQIDPKSFAATGEWKTVFESPATNSVEIWGVAGGGKLLISNDVLYFAIGDYSIYRGDSRTEHAAQDVKSPFGKIYSYDLASSHLSLKSIGHRNTQGLVMTEGGELLNVEHGPQGGDEINLIKDGKNYGWPIATYGTEYGTYTWPLQESNSALSLEIPMFAFVPSIAISSILQIKGFSDRWKGDLLVGSLKAQSLYRLKYVSDRVVFSEPIWIGHRIRDIAEVESTLYLLTDDALILELAVDGDRLAANARSADVPSDKSLAKCMLCHHFGETNPTSVAPTLSNIGSRRIASDTFNGYSSALRNLSGTWNSERLFEFISNPGRVAPGTVMPKIDLSSDEARAIAEALTAGAPAGNFVH